MNEPMTKFKIRGLKWQNPNLEDWNEKLWNLGSIWIPLIVENWKYYSKINFKCVNSTVKPNFNENFAEFHTCRSHE